MSGPRFLFLSCLVLFPLCSRAADDVIDQYLSAAVSYLFVRRTPEGATPNRVLMTVFEDFLCPACYRTATEIIPPLKTKYGDRLEIRFVGFPLIHPESRTAARAYAIAQEMGLGKEMQEALFKEHYEDDIDTTSREGLAKVADSIGLAPELLLSRLDSDGGSVEVDRDLAQGRSYQIDAVPGIIFDGWMRANDISQENLEKIIDGLLEKKKATNSTIANGTTTKSSNKGRKAAP